MPQGKLVQIEGARERKETERQMGNFNPQWPRNPSSWKNLEHELPTCTRPARHVAWSAFPICRCVEPPGIPLPSHPCPHPRLAALPLDHRLHCSFSLA